MADEVALFVDLDNVVYSLWNTRKQEPDPRQWMGKARRYGPVSFARAYGDFSHDVMARIKPRLDVSGIDAFPCPVKTRDSGTQSTVDIHVAVDLFEVALDRPDVTTFMLMAGDRDYIRIITRLRNRWGKQNIVSGVPGTVSCDLAQAADREDPIEVDVVAFDVAELVRIIQRFESSLTASFHPTFSRMKTYVTHPVNAQVIDPNVAHNTLSDFVQREVLLQEIVDRSDGGQLKATRVNREHPLVQTILEKELP